MPLLSRALEIWIASDEVSFPLVSLIYSSRSMDQVAGSLSRIIYHAKSGMLGVNRVRQGELNCVYVAILQSRR
jgi:hypothetical protein